jgi:hypothetical protein
MYEVNFQGKQRGAASSAGGTNIKQKIVEINKQAEYTLGLG